MKKHFTLLLTAMLCSLLAIAQVPQGVNFQGIARDNNGLALAQGTIIGLRLSVLQGSATGNAVYSEEFPLVTLERGGIFNVVLGKGTPITGLFSGINWQGGSKFMRVEMRQGTSGSYTALSTTEIMSVPYAQHAGNGIATATVNGQGQLVITNENGNAITAGNVVGPAGPAGAVGPQGSAGPTGSTGPQGPAGAQGPQGLAGATGAQGPAGPAGPQGVAGATGPQGLAGLDGKSVLNGNVPPITTIGSNGDFYLDVNTKLMYGPKTSAGWGNGFSVVGPQGPAGSFPNGSNPGAIPFWNGSQWVTLSGNVYYNGGNVGIGTQTPDNSATLEINSQSQGMLVPRLTTAQRNSISSPATGLIIFNTTTGCPNYYNNNQWYEWCGNVTLPTGLVTSLDCSNLVNLGTLTNGQLAMGVRSILSYSGGNGGGYNELTVSSTGVNGLTARIAAGTLTSNVGTFTIEINGTPQSSGIASFLINIGGQTCSVIRSVSPTPPPSTFPSGTVNCNGVQTAVVEVTNPTTGRIWMDRNLGASRVALNASDSLAFGGLYQWGKPSDGHQCRNSSLTSVKSSSSTPNTASFYIGYSWDDWLSPSNDNLWQGINGANNPCPSGFRLPTLSELNAESVSWAAMNSTGGFNSNVKWVVSGRRNENGNLVFSNSDYWTSNAIPIINPGSPIADRLAWSLSFSNNSTVLFESRARLMGCAVRCIKN